MAYQFILSTLVFWVAITRCTRLLVADAQEISNGDTVCTEGYIMDKYCIDRRTLLDNPSVTTLKNPELHSVHCLVDVSFCRNSGFVVLHDPVQAGGLYTQGYALDDPGTQALVDLARHVGVWDASDCYTCTTDHGHLRKGMRAGIMGTVVDAEADPPIISVTSVEYVSPSESYCATQGAPSSPTSAPPSKTSDGLPTKNDFVPAESGVMQSERKMAALYGMFAVVLWL